MTLVLFLMGILIGVLLGGAICVRFLRREISADIGPKLRTIQGQLDRLDSEISLALATNLSEISERYARKAMYVPPPGGGAGSANPGSG
jgi:uncharacterized membrane-anchored protein YhcB (DUF1043 family)